MNAETKANHYLTCDIVYSRYSQGHNNPKDYKKWVSGIASDKLANLLCNDSRRIKIVVFVAKNRCDWRASDCLLHNLNKSISFFFCSLYTERDMIYMSHWASTFSTISRINCNTRFCPSLIGCFLPLLTCCNSEWISGMWDVLQFLMSLCRSYSWHFTQSVQHATVKWSNCVFVWRWWLLVANEYPLELPRIWFPPLYSMHHPPIQLWVDFRDSCWVLLLDTLLQGHYESQEWYLGGT